MVEQVWLDSLVFLIDAIGLLCALGRRGSDRADVALTSVRNRGLTAKARTEVCPQVTSPRDWYGGLSTCVVRNLVWIAAPADWYGGLSTCVVRNLVWIGPLI